MPHKHSPGTRSYHPNTDTLYRWEYGWRDRKYRDPGRHCLNMRCRSSDNSYCFLYLISLCLKVLCYVIIYLADKWTTKRKESSNQPFSDSISNPKWSPSSIPYLPWHLDRRPKGTHARSWCPHPHQPCNREEDPLGTWGARWRRHPSLWAFPPSRQLRPNYDIPQAVGIESNHLKRVDIDKQRQRSQKVLPLFLAQTHYNLQIIFLTPRSELICRYPGFLLWPTSNRCGFVFPLNENSQGHVHKPRSLCLLHCGWKYSSTSVCLWQNPQYLWER